MKSYLIIPLLIFSMGVWAQGKKTYTSVMRTTGSATMWDTYKPVMYGFAENPIKAISFPAQTLVATEGDSVYVKAWNISQEHHTIHLHGLDVDMINDGDPMTSFELDHQQMYTYTFKAKNAGTYLYHCHTADVVHVQMGMYGLVVVKPKDPMTAWTGGPRFEKEYSFLMSELDAAWHDNIPKHDVTTMTAKIPKYEPSYFLINGKSKQLFTDTILGNIGSNIYLRLANIGFYDNQVILPAALNAQIIDSDGRPLPKARKRDTLNISPGERYGVMINAPSTAVGNIKVNFVELNTKTIKGFENIIYSINNTVRVEDKQLEQLFHIYPNPTNNELYIKSKIGAPEILHWRLNNMVGKSLMESSVPLENSGFQSINTSILQNGMYFLNINLPNGVSLTQKILVQKY